MLAFRVLKFEIMKMLVKSFLMRIIIVFRILFFNFVRYTLIYFAKNIFPCLTFFWKFLNIKIKHVLNEHRVQTYCCLIFYHIYSKYQNRIYIYIYTCCIILRLTISCSFQAKRRPATRNEKLVLLFFFLLKQNITLEDIFRSV